MSFGFGIGDFITVLRLANDLRQRFVDAPVQFKEISEEWAIYLYRIEKVLILF